MRVIKSFRAKGLPSPAASELQSFSQRKLTIGGSNDVYEKEADDMANKVMGETPGQLKFTSTNQLQKKESNADPVSAAPIVQDALSSSSGRSMDEDTRSYMESRFNYDFSNVKIHDDELSAKSASSINALAYTSGNDIVFNSEQYNPDSDSGKRLLAHELTHVVQQNENLHSKPIQRTVIDANVITNNAIETRLALSRQEIIDTIRAGDADAIVVAQAAEDALTTQLGNATSGGTVDPGTETALNEELGLSFTNSAQRGLIRQQISRFRRVRETLESGYLRYLSLGIGNISLIGCEPGPCGDEFASSCPGNRLIVFCQPFWDTPDEQSATILHEPFHIWFSMLRHADNALRRADASCFESFALRVAGRAAFASCVGHTNG